MVEMSALLEWYRRERRAKVSEGEAIELYFTNHPRTSFLKMLPADASVCDIGAGDGSLSIFRKWLRPVRADLKMYAYSIEKGARFDEFDGYAISDWNVAPPSFGDVRFDGVICAHFIEHIQTPDSLVAWLSANLLPGGRAYIEWPSPNALHLPPVKALKAEGVDIMISRYDDDDTHQGEIPDREALCRAFASSGFAIEAQGIVRLPWIENELMATSRDAVDPFPRQAAFWLKTGWSQYVIVQK